MNKKRKKPVVIIIIIPLVLIVIAVFAFFQLAPQFGAVPSKERLINRALNSRYEGGKFMNTENTPVILPNSYGRMIKQQFNNNPGRVPDRPLPANLPDFGNDSLSNALSVIWLGHSTVLIRIQGITIITDPVFSERVSPVSFLGPRRFETAHEISIGDLPAIDIVLISHDHFDHLDHKTIKALDHNVKTFIVPLGIRDHLEKWGVLPEKICELDWWESSSVSGLQFNCTPARHFSALASVS